jgi:hypothetical protein
LISSLIWFVFSLFFLRITRSSIFVVSSIIAFLASLTTCYVIAGMEDWEPETTSILYLIPGIVFFVFGVLLDRRRYVKYAVPLCAVGLMLVVVCLSTLALNEKMLLFKWSFLKPSERILLGFVCNGIIYLCLAGICRRLGTRLQRTLAQVLNWLGPVHILAVLRVLDSEKFRLQSDHLMVYRIVLPVASMAFVFGSVARQMKSFFFSGLAGISAAVHKFTLENFDKLFAWPVSLIAVGMVWMAVSWLVPRWQANIKLKYIE